MTYHTVGLQGLAARGHGLLLDGRQHVADVLRQLDAQRALGPPTSGGTTVLARAVGGAPSAVTTKVLRDVKGRVVGHAGGVQVVCVFILLSRLGLLQEKTHRLQKLQKIKKSFEESKIYLSFN